MYIYNSRYFYINILNTNFEHWKTVPLGAALFILISIMFVSPFKYNVGIAHAFTRRYFMLDIGWLGSNVGTNESAVKCFEEM